MRDDHFADEIIHLPVGTAVATRAAQLDEAAGDEVGQAEPLTLQAMAYLDLGLQ